MVTIDDENLRNRVDSLDQRVAEQQAKREGELSGWRWLLFGLGIVVTRRTYQRYHP